MRRPAATPERARDRLYMRLALAEARAARRLGEVPVGAVIVHEGAIVARGHNESIAGNDPSAHAEIVALRAAGRALANYRLNGSVLYATLEPCVMCYAAMVHARIARLVYGAADPKTGALSGALRLHEPPAFNHAFAVTGGVLKTECGGVLKAFFSGRRAAPAPHKGAGATASRRDGLGVLMDTSPSSQSIRRR